MASIGELTATVRADISGYVGPMKQVAATTQQTAAALQATGAATASTIRPLGQMRGAFFDLAASAVGVRGKLSNAVEGLLLFGGGSAAVIAATAGIAAIASAFSAMRDRAEEAKKPIEEAHATIHDMMTDVVSAGRQAEAVLNKQIGDLRRQRAALRREVESRFSVSDPSAIPESAIRGASTAYAQLSDQIANLEGEAKNLNLTLSSQEGLEHRTSAAAKALAAALRELAEITQGFKSGGKAFDQEKANALRKQAQEYEAIAQGAKHAAAAEQERREAFLKTTSSLLGKGMDSKDQVNTDREALVSASQSAADTLSQAFMGQFRDQQKNFAATFTTVLGAAIREAIAKLIAQKIFGALFSFITGGLGGGKGVSGTGGFISNLFGAPSAQSAMGGPTTITVPLSNLPRPMTPIEQARDAMWQSVFTETSRTLQGNNVRLATR